MVLQGCKGDNRYVLYRIHTRNLLLLYLLPSLLKCYRYPLLCFTPNDMSFCYMIQLLFEITSLDINHFLWVPFLKTYGEILKNNFQYLKPKPLYDAINVQPQTSVPPQITIGGIPSGHQVVNLLVYITCIGLLTSYIYSPWAPGGGGGGTQVLNDYPLPNGCA